MPSIPTRTALTVSLTLAFALAHIPALAQDARTPVIAYRVTFRPEPDAQRWDVSLTASGLDPAQRDLVLELDGWGEWPEVDSLYLRALTSDPPLTPDPESPMRWQVETPADWDGTLRVSYQIPMTRHGSQVHERYGLFPWYREDFGAGFTINTLMSLRAGGEPAEAERTVTFVAPEGLAIATGLAGLSYGEQTAPLQRGWENAVIYFGRPHAQARGQAAGQPVEVFQFGQGPDVTAHALEVAQAIATAVGQTTGRTVDHPIRVLMHDSDGSIGGTNTDHGLTMRFAQATPDGRLHPDSCHILAHELTHDWLGGMLAFSDESLVWFKEGFTDYLALWHSAYAGLIDADEFAEHLAGIDSRARSGNAYGQVRFSDPEVNWRDGDGPNESFGYKGGAMLAFFLDLELHRRGGPRLPAMIGDMIGEGVEPTQASIRAWMVAHGLEDFYAEYVDKPQLPELHAALLEIGYSTERTDLPLTYVGATVEGHRIFGTVTAVDPDGPAAKAGMKVGDQITGMYPARELAPSVPEDIDTPYRFALDLIDPDRPGTYIGVLRAGERIRLEIQPRTISGGYTERFVASERVRTFFQR